MHLKNLKPVRDNNKISTGFLRSAVLPPSFYLFFKIGGFSMSFHSAPNSHHHQPPVNTSGSMPFKNLTLETVAFYTNPKKKLFSDLKKKRHRCSMGVLPAFVNLNNNSSSSNDHN